MYFTRKRWPGPLRAFGLVAVFFLAGAAVSIAAEVEDGRALFLKGDYAACIRMARKGLGDSTWDADWAELLAKAQLAVGQYPEAQKTVEKALESRRSSVQLRLLAYDVFNANGLTNRAAEVLAELNELGSSRLRSYYRDAPSLVALGRAALLLNLDPKLVLENFFDQAKRNDPNCREAWLASGDLALDKHDYALAAKTFSEALKKFPNDVDAEFGLARAFEPSDRARMAESIEAVLGSNSNHVASLLLLADHLVDAEEYADAEIMLARALSVNPWRPEAWAFRALLAHLRNDAGGEATNRQAALKYWSTNPRVDYLIGRKLSQKYRFNEGSAYQRQALKFDPNFLPARIQLADDLLRMGNEPEGWQLAAQVHEQDGYDVTAYNLVTLHDTMGKFKTLTNRDFIVRMNPREADIYGDRVLNLLQRAKDRLSEKYNCELDQPTVVEIFADQKDFGVRTFGMPQNPGYLGVCFGHVITANSPAAQAGHPSNWEAVLWHEFCHVITLNLTRNKMPRWLSEGISVYEERQANPTWGQGMTPRYREMILGEDFVPISDLSAAFMAPKTPFHMQFAYYESALVVEYVVKNFGLDALKQILKDLGDGVDIQEAMARHTVPMDKLETDFAAFATGQAKNLAPGLDWKKPRGEEEANEDSSTNLNEVIDRLVKQAEPVTNAASTNLVQVTKPPLPPGNSVATRHQERVAPVLEASQSPNYWTLTEEAKTDLAAKKWQEAKAPLQKLIDLYPKQTGADSAYAMLAFAHRGLNETNEERAVLIRLAALEADSADAFLRLTELDEAVKDWPGMSENAERFLAVNPLVPQPYRYLARASEELGRTDAATRSYRRLLMLDDPDLAEVHYRLARLLGKQGDAAGAKRQVLQALEEAPRFRDAQSLLLEIENRTEGAASGSPPVKP